MGTKTGIEWTDATWNPILGCSRVSEGCRNCYAEGIAVRFSNTPGPCEGLAQTVNGHPRWTGKISETKQLLNPLKWRKPKRIFVNSMSDLFHENVTDEQRDKIFAVMTLRPQHTFQVLTKRPENGKSYITSHGRTSSIYNAAALLVNGDFSRFPDNMAHHRSSGAGWWPLPNVWLGVSAENQATADERIPLLLQTPAAVRFLSAEPLLGPVNLEDLPSASGIGRFLDALSNAGVDAGAAVPTCLDWVICGGESGPGARPMNPDWARSLRDQCVAAKVPYFFKQWGEWLPPMQDGAAGEGQILNASDSNVRVGKKAAGALLDGREWKQFPHPSDQDLSLETPLPEAR